MKFIFLTLISCYQILISPFLPRCCRFTPTCSQYAWEAIHRYGAYQGMIIFLKRLIKCHPWGDSGYDPVPPFEESHHEAH